MLKIPITTTLKKYNTNIIGREIPLYKDFLFRFIYYYFLKRALTAFPWRTAYWTMWVPDRVISHVYSQST